MVSVAAIIITVIGFIICLAGGLVGFLLFPNLVTDRVNESVRLSEGSDAFERWETLPMPIAYKIYFFNVSNPEDVQKGAQPIVKEIGPYIYNQHRTKINITKEDDIFSYYQHQLFEFNAEASAPLTQFDEMTVLNLPLMTTVSVAEYTAGSLTSLLTALNSAIPTIFGTPSSVFLKTTPQDFLFDGIYVFCNNTGILNTLVCSRIEAHTPKMMPRLEDGRFRFTLLGHKNNSHDGYYSINSGMTDIYQLGEIVAWENSSTIDTWGEEGTCNNVMGSDASLYPPFRTPESELQHFNTDICRSVNISYFENTEFSGIDAHRYVVEENVLDSPSNYSENQCFCLNRTQGIRGDDGCLLDGAMELWNCIGVPVVLSLPHFYLANDAYKNGVEGLSPNESLHRMFVDLEPNTGTVLRGSKRVQFNVFIRPIKNIALTTNLSTTLMPVVWIDEGIELNDELIGILNEELFDVLNILSIIKWSTTIGGAILFVVGLIWLLISLRKPSSKNV